MLEVLAGIGQHHGARPQIAAPYAYRIRGAKCAGQQTKGMAPLPPLAGVDITVGPPPDLPYLWRVDPQHLEPPARQSLNEGDPRDPRRFQGDGGDTTPGQPVGHGCSVDRVRPKAAHRLRIVTRGHRPIMRFGPHVDARGVSIDGSELGWESRLRASQRWLPLSHDDRHYHRGQSQGQWARERPSSRTLPHGIRPAPVTTGVATSSQDQPHQRAHSTNASPASYNPL
jgi:hypothetical protein